MLCSYCTERERKERERERSRSPVRLPEVDQFIDENNINAEAATKIRTLSPESQRKVISRPLTGDVQNPSKVMIARVRELQNQEEKSKSGGGSDSLGFWGDAMLQATAQAVAKYIEDNHLDSRAAKALRALPPQHQAVAIRWDLSHHRNRSEKFLSMAAVLGSGPAPGMPMPPMYGLPHVPGPGGHGRVRRGANENRTVPDRDSVCSVKTCSHAGSFGSDTHP
ncbi:unnamed protein product [Symbiodinium sp. CCMP2592]|nr:unnamed protein product [Symbiodinium sp. CCMP2592]